METLGPLSDFFRAIKADYRISTTHIAVYAALLEFWADSGFSDPLFAFRYEIMATAKINSPYTYHKCLRELHEYGYIIYQPTRKKNQRSRIYLPLNGASAPAGQFQRRF